MEIIPVIQGNIILGNESGPREISLVGICHGGPEAVGGDAADGEWCARQAREVIVHVVTAGDDDDRVGEVGGEECVEGVEEGVAARGGRGVAAAQAGFGHDVDVLWW